MCIFVNQQTTFKISILKILRWICGLSFFTGSVKPQCRSELGWVLCSFAPLPPYPSGNAEQHEAEWYETSHDLIIQFIFMTACTDDPAGPRASYQPLVWITSGWRKGHRAAAHTGDNELACFWEWGLHRSTERGMLIQTKGSTKQGCDSAQVSIREVLLTTARVLV